MIMQIKKCIVAVLAVAGFCFANAQETSPDHIEEIFALAKKFAEQNFIINFGGFFTGMSRYDAQDLSAYYKLKDGEYLIVAKPGKAVSKLWFSLKGVRRITMGGSTLDERAQALANGVGDGGLTIQYDQLASQTPRATVEAARKDKADMDAAEKAAAEAIKGAIPSLIKDMIRDMIAIQGKSFMIGKYEVTQAQWQAVMGENPSNFKGYDNYDNPVEKVSWNDCKKFLERLNAMPEVKASGLTFRLPTEAEWEYACLAGSKGDYCKLADGTEITGTTLGEVAWYQNNRNFTTHPVGKKKPNAFGLYDMHGNVSEWCEDLYEAGNSRRVRRGGSWYNASGDCSVGYRRGNSPGHRTSNVGFRLAASKD